VAQRQGNGAGTTGLTWLLGDHLGSTAITASADGTLQSELRFKPWGEPRFVSGATLTDRRYTGQRTEGTGLVDYGARFYDPSLGRWVQPDSLIPDPANSLDFDRYQYVRGNPLKYVDPTGHMQACSTDSGNGCEGFGPDRIISSYGYDTDKIDSVLRSFVRTHKNYSFEKDPGLNETERSLVANAQFQVSAQDRDYQNAWAYGAAFSTSAILLGGGTGGPDGGDSAGITSEHIYCRYCSNAKAKAIEETGILRGGRPGTTYFTTDKYATADEAQQALALHSRPEVRIDFTIRNSPQINGPRVVERDFGQPGGGIEFWSDDPVRVFIRAIIRLFD
jgi:RHS repeat-associated protein